jgi:hypothetical protein
MTGDIEPTTDPDALVPLDVIEEPGQALGPGGAPGEATVESHRHHPGQPGAFAVEHIERVPRYVKNSSPVPRPAGVQNLPSLASSVYGTTRWGVPATLTQ